MSVSACPIAGKEIVVPSAGAQIHAFLYGQSGPWVVLLHGNGEDHTIFSQQIAHLAQHFRLIAIDSRGHGASGFAKPLTIAQMAQDVLAVLDVQGVLQAAVVGFSDGGNIALSLAIAAPKRLWALVASGANLSPKGVQKRVQIPIVLGWALCAFMGWFSKNARQQAAVLRLMVKEPHIAPVKLANVLCPCLIMAGEKDIILPSHTQMIADSLPRSQKAILAGAGHDVFNQCAQKVNEILLAFLRQGAPVDCP